MFPYYDFKPEEFTLKDFNDQTWGETDFPNTFERIFSRKFIDGAFWIRIFSKNKITFHAVIKDSLRFMTLEKGHTTRFTRLK